jgi:Icc-related predicted phosphoesterase
MRIVHFSDWHGNTYELPSADLYVCTGDMLPNFRIFEYQVKGERIIWEANMELLGETPRQRPNGPVEKLPPSRERDTVLQARFINRRGPGYLRAILESPDAPVICVRGNHDFVDLAPLFAGGPVFEINEDPTRTTDISVLGTNWRIGGVRGINAIRRRWSDELRPGEFAERAWRLPCDLDILVTHAPPQGILDSLADGTELIGSASLMAYVVGRGYTRKALRAHLFGHVHEERGSRQHGPTIFSNASCAWNVIDL